MRTEDVFGRLFVDRKAGMYLDFNLAPSIEAKSRSSPVTFPTLSRGVIYILLPVYRLASVAGYHVVIRPPTLSFTPG